MEEKVGLKLVPPLIGAAVLPLIGGLASLPPNELDAVVDMSWPVAPSELPPGFSFNCLFKYAMYSPLDLRLSYASASFAFRVEFIVLSSLSSTFVSSNSF